MNEGRDTGDFCQLGIEIGSDTVERIKKGNMT